MRADVIPKGLTFAEIVKLLKVFEELYPAKQDPNQYSYNITRKAKSVLDFQGALDIIGLVNSGHLVLSPHPVITKPLKMAISINGCNR